MRSAKAKARAWIFTNHCSLPKDLSRLQPEDCIIAVDKGLETVHRLNIEPALIIGDFDSLADPTLLKTYAHIPIITLDPEKNATDTELALDWAISNGYKQISILNDLGGRFDHALALIQNLLGAFLQACDCRIETGSQILFFLETESRLDYPVGTLLSLIPYGSQVIFNRSNGLQYPLDDLLIKSSQSRGISNVISQSPALISKREGQVLAVVTIL